MFNEPEHVGIVIGAVLSTVGAMVLFYAFIWRSLIKPLQKTVTTVASALEANGEQTPKLVQAVQTTVRAANDQQAQDILGKFEQYVQSQNNLIQVFQETNKFKETILLNLQQEFAAFKQQAALDKKVLQDQIDSQCRLLEGQGQKIESMRQSSEAKDIQLADKDRTIAELTAKVSQLEARVQALEKKVADLEMDKAELERLLAEAQQARDTEKARADKLANDLSRTEASLAAAEAELLQLRAKANEATQTDSADILLTVKPEAKTDDGSGA